MLCEVEDNRNEWGQYDVERGVCHCVVLFCFFLTFDHFVVITRTVILFDETYSMITVRYTREKRRFRRRYKTYK